MIPAVACELLATCTKAAALLVLAVLLVDVVRGAWGPACNRE